MKGIPRIKTAMTPFPHSVELVAPLAQAKRFMRSHKIRHLPVTTGTELVGVITDRDTKMVLGPDFDYPDESELTVEDAYIPDPYIVDLEQRLDAVLTEMARRHIGSALVTRRGKLAGIFTATDACALFATYLRDRFPGGGGDAA